MAKVDIILFGFVLLLINSCMGPETNISYDNPDLKILFLHHSTGRNIWYGDVDQYQRLNLKKSTCMVPRLIKEYNERTGKKISIEEQTFPSGEPYPWHNYPFDYYNIWVKNAGENSYMQEPTLEMLTPDFDIIIFKHCFPVSSIEEDDGKPDINSKKKTLENYKLQYKALKDKMNEFPGTKFIVWTGAALVEGATNENEAKRALEFYKWVTEIWDVEGDNIEIFDFRKIETQGGMFLKPEYATSSTDSHPNLMLSEKAALQFVDRIISVVE
jgi:hypothetical protein